MVLLAWWIWIYPSKSQWQATVAYLNVSSWNHKKILNLKRYLFTHITFMPFEGIHGNQFVNINNAIPLTSEVNSIRCKHLFYIATWLDLFCIWKHFKTFLHFLFCVSGLWLLWYLIFYLLCQLCIPIPCALACVLPFPIYHWHIWSGDILIPYSAFILKLEEGFLKREYAYLLLLLIPYSFPCKMTGVFW